MREVCFYLTTEFFEDESDIDQEKVSALRASIIDLRAHGLSPTFYPVRDEMSTLSEIEMLKIKHDLKVEVGDWITR